MLKSKIVIASAIYAVLAWISALLVRFNSGGNDTYSTIVFGAFLVLAVWGTIAMYAVVVISSVVAIVKTGKANGEKSDIMICIIRSIISSFLVSTVYLSYNILDFHF